MNLANSFCGKIKRQRGAFLLAVTLTAGASIGSSTGSSIGASTEALPEALKDSSMTPSLNLIKVPRLRQATDYTCGVCALQAVLAYYGEDVREDMLARALKANPKEGTRYQAIADYSRAHGFSVEIKKEAELTDLEGILKSGRPVICLIQAWGEIKSTSREQKVDYKKDWQDGHYVVAIGFDKDNIYFMDPSTVGTYTFIKRDDFLDRWHDTDGHEKLHHFVMVISKDKPYDPEAITEIK
jgi:predicted double-glycine peptidase